MKLSPAEMESILALLTRIYMDLHEIETEYRLMAGDNDFRPRIEHFHDAVRAFSSQDPAHLEAGGRLSVEFLAHDLSSLRFLQTMPLAGLKAYGSILSPEMMPVKVGENDLVAKAKRPTRQVRERICDLYQHYSVLFAALMKPMADRDYLDRVDALDHDVKDTHSLIAQLEAMVKGKNNLPQVMAAIQHLEDEALRYELVQFMQQEKYKKKENLVKLISFLKTHLGDKDKLIANVDAAHMNYVMSQLAIFEGSRDMIKKMAAQGMNLVGKFVQSAIAESKRDMGR